jgi:hypothetical protein
MGAIVPIIGPAIRQPNEDGEREEKDEDSILVSSFIASHTLKKCMEKKLRPYEAIPTQHEIKNWILIFSSN